MPPDEAKSQNWWTTIPGILTGLAALITAIGGLLIAVHQVSDRSGTRQGVRPPIAAGQPASPSPASNAAASPSPSNSPAAVELALPATSEVKLNAGNTVVRILKVQLEAFNAEKRALTFTVRHTNRGRYPANFWSSSYRLILDDVPQAPTNLLDEVVDGDSAKVGEVTFEIPTAITAVVLQVSSGDEKTRIPVSLAAAVP